MWNFFWTLQLETWLWFWVPHWGQVHKFIFFDTVTYAWPWVDASSWEWGSAYDYSDLPLVPCEAETCWSGVTEDWSQLFRRMDFAMWNERSHFNTGLIRFGFIILQTTFALWVLNFCKMWWQWLFQVKTFQPAGIFCRNLLPIHHQVPFSPISDRHLLVWLISAAIRCQAPEWWTSNSWSHFMLLCSEEKSKGRRVRPSWSFTKLSWLTCTDGQMLSGVISVLQPALWVDNLSACHHRCSRDYGSHVNI